MKKRSLRRYLKKAISLLLILCMMLGYAAPAQAATNSHDLTTGYIVFTGGNQVRINDAEPIAVDFPFTITGNGFGENYIGFTGTPNGTVVLSGLDYKRADDGSRTQPMIEIEDNVTATLELAGENVLAATADSSAGINVPAGTTLNLIAPSGSSLTVKGAKYGAGIGGNGGYFNNIISVNGESAGTINIYGNGGMVSAYGGAGAAGIGGGGGYDNISVDHGGNGGNGGTVKINETNADTANPDTGSVTVNAYGLFGGAGIGGGAGGVGDLSYGNGGNGGSIIVYDGKVNAESAKTAAYIGNTSSYMGFAAGIGGGAGGGANKRNYISSSDISESSTSGRHANYGGSGGSISIQGGTIAAIGNTGIGGGAGGNGADGQKGRSGSDSNGADAGNGGAGGNAGTITIAGGIVTATGTYVGIGGGRGGNGGNGGNGLNANNSSGSAGGNGGHGGNGGYGGSGGIFTVKDGSITINVTETIIGIGGAPAGNGGNGGHGGYGASYSFYNSSSGRAYGGDGGKGGYGGSGGHGGNGGTIRVEGGTITATGTTVFNGADGGNGGNGGNGADGGTAYVLSSSFADAFGGNGGNGGIGKKAGDGGDGAVVTIIAGKITATGWDNTTNETHGGTAGTAGIGGTGGTGGIATGGGTDTSGDPGTSGSDGASASDGSPGTVTRMPGADVSITGAPTTNPIYGGANFTLTADVTTPGTNPTWDWDSDDENVLTVTDSGVVTIVGVGTATITANYASDTANGSDTLDITVDPRPLSITGLTATARQYDGTTDVTLTGGALSNKVGNDDVSAIMPTTGTVISADASTAAKAVTVTKPTLSGLDADNYTLSDITGLTVMINPKQLTLSTATATNRDYDPDSTDVAISAVSFAESAPLPANSDYTVTGSMTDAHAGTGKTVTASITLTDGNYTFANNQATATIGTTVDISKIDFSGTITPGTYSTIAGTSVSFTLPDISGLTDESFTYKSKTEGEAVITGEPTISADGKKLNFTVAQGATIGDTASIVLTVSSKNHNNTEYTINLTVSDKLSPSLSADNITVDYTGQALNIDSFTGKTALASDGLTPLTGGTWAIEGAPELISANPNGINVTLKFTPSQADSATYTSATTTVTLIINKATPKGAATVTAIGEAGKTLADAILDKSRILGVDGNALDGIVVWDDALTVEVEANKAYAYTFTPTDTTNYTELKDTLIPYSYTPPSGGGGGDRGNATTTPLSQVSDDISQLPSTEDIADMSEQEATEQLEALEETLADIAELSDQDKEKLSEADIDALKLAYTELNKKTDANSEHYIDPITGITAVDTVVDETTEEAPRLVVEPIIDAADIEEALQGLPDGADTQNLIAYDVSLLLGDIEVQPNGELTITLPGFEDYIGRYISISHKVMGVSWEYYLNIPVEDDGTISITVTSLSPFVFVATDAPMMAFDDVDSDDWFYDAVKYVFESEIMNGIATTQFNPEGDTTRAMMVTVLHRLAQEPMPEDLNSFTDIEADSWYETAVSWAAKQGITLGVSDTHFAPDLEITREQFVAMLYRYQGEPTASGTINFADAGNISGYALNAMIWATQNGILAGFEDNTLRPTETATRAELATMLMRYLSL